MKLSTILIHVFSLLLVTLAIGEEQRPQKVIRETLAVTSWQSETIDQIEKHFSTVIIPEIRFKETPLKDAINFIQQKSVELDHNPDVNRKGISVIVSFPDDSTKKTKDFEVEQTDADQFGFKDDGDSQSDPPITLSLSQTSVLEAFSEIASLAGMKLRITGYALILEPIDTPEPKTLSYKYQLSQDLKAKILTAGKVRTTADPFASTNAPKTETIFPKTIREALELRGHFFNDTNQIEYSDTSKQLTLIATLKHINKFEQLLYFATDGDLQLVDAETGVAIKIQDFIYTKTYQIEPDHWLWLYRIANNDSKLIPEGYDISNPNYQLIWPITARKAYAACGVKITKGETFLYGPTTPTLIAKLSLANHRKVKAINQQVIEWRKKTSN